MRDFHRISDPIARGLHNLPWITVYGWQRLVRGALPARSIHLIIGLADHFEPSYVPNVPSGTCAEFAEQMRRIERWCREYPKMADPYRDHHGRPFRHTYFYPAEQYHEPVIERLAEHCQAGWGEIEIQLHHGMNAADTAENTRRVILEFRDALEGHGCLSRLDDSGPPRYAFVHGNWALANSAGGRWCGVDNEMQILAETGCYADFTLPSAPSSAQISKINAIYECARPLNQRAPHRRGRNLEVGRRPTVFPLIIQGPLQLRFTTNRRAWTLPRIENGDLSTANPPSMYRLGLWRNAAVTVRGRPEWVFIKLHCHGMDPHDEAAMLGEPIRHFLRELIESSKEGSEYKLHFVTAREMVNIVFAACDGFEGDPHAYRDYRLKLISFVRTT